MIKKLVLGVAALAVVLFTIQTYRSLTAPSRAANDAVDEIQDALDAIPE